MNIKRIAVLISAAVLCISATACGNTEPGAGEENPEGSALEEVSEVNYEKADNITGMLGIGYDGSKKAKNIFAGLDYKFSRETSDYYHDTEAHLLTDGVTSDTFNAKDFVAWTGGGSVKIDFDLGAGEHALAEVNAGCLRQMSYAIGLPAYVEVQASNDAVEYISLGRMIKPEDVGVSDKINYHFSFPSATGARYIRIVFGSQDNGFLFVDEISGYEYGDDGDYYLDLGKENVDDTRYYDLYGYSLGNGKVNVSESDPDYDVYQNLMLLNGTDVTAYHFDPISKTGGNDTGKEGLNLLRDGRSPSVASYDASGWAKFWRGMGRHVVADFGTELAVGGFKATFLSYETAGVAVPPLVCVSLSSDGENWVPVYAGTNPTYNTVPLNYIHVFETEFDSVYLARYVRITFATQTGYYASGMVYVGETEVWGKKNTAGAVPPSPCPGPYGRYPDTSAEGYSNILFAPVTNEFGEHCTENNALTYESALRYLAKVEENGEISGVFMDSVAFSTRGAMSEYTERFDGMSFYFDELFNYDDTNLAAANKVKGEINEKLGINDKLKIWIGVNMPEKGDTFKGEDAAGLEKALECLEWQADEIIKRFDSGNYENLELVGFYWQYECFRINSFDFPAAKGFNEYIHSLGYKSFWCPYYTAHGYWLCHDAGFDITCLQPNYMFYSTAGENRLSTCAELAKLYGMCVEIEIEEPETLRSREMYYEYLLAGIASDYIKSVKVYYQGGLPGAYVTASKSRNETVRRLYDITLKYAAEELVPADFETSFAEVSEFGDVDAEVNSSSKKALLTLERLDTVVYRIKQSPLFGSFRIDLNGKIVYKQNVEHAGDDILILQLLDKNGNTKDVTVRFIHA